MTMTVACEQFIDAVDIECDCSSLGAQDLSDLIDQASDILAILSYGEVTGRCTETRRPRGPGGCTCRCTEIVSCGCNPLRGVTLRGPNPVVTEVLIDGVAFTDFKVIDETLLIRTDGQNWPGCQDLALDGNAVGAFQITYTYGAAIPLLGKRAAEEIICSLYSNPPQEQRKLHPQTRGLNIAGVNIQLEQLTEEIKRRTFLLPNVVRFLTVYAPDAVPAFVYSPELEDGWQLHSST